VRLTGIGKRYGDGPWALFDPTSVEQRPTRSDVTNIMELPGRAGPQGTAFIRFVAACGD
jgi:hypothetical protein